MKYCLPSQAVEGDGHIIGVTALGDCIANIPTETPQTGVDLTNQRPYSSTHPLRLYFLQIEPVLKPEMGLETPD
jgi:hypothetical protein